MILQHISATRLDRRIQAMNYSNSLFKLSIAAAIGTFVALAIPVP